MRHFLHMPSPNSFAFGVFVLLFLAWLSLSAYLVSGLFGRRARDIESTEDEPTEAEFNTEE